MSTYYRSDTPEKCVTTMKKSGKLAVALAVVAIGVLLLFLGNNHRAAGKDTDDTPAAPATGADDAAVETYRLTLERRVADICAEVRGAGTVSVVVTLSGGYEYVYATDKKVTSGGESTTYITIGQGDDEALVYITERPPAISGIGVVCAGGMDDTVRREIISLVSAAFGVPTNKIYVTGRK